MAEERAVTVPLPAAVDVYVPAVAANVSIPLAVIEVVTQGSGMSVGAADDRYVNITGDTMTGALTATNQSGAVSLAVGAPVPAGLPAGTIIVRY